MALSSLSHGISYELVEQGQRILSQDPKIKGAITIFKEFIAFAKAHEVPRSTPAPHALCRSLRSSGRDAAPVGKMQRKVAFKVFMRGRSASQDSLPLFQKALFREGEWLEPTPRAKKAA